MAGLPLAGSAGDVQDGVGVWGGAWARTSIASAVGRMTRSTLRRRASSRTCCITGKAPSAPVPITSRLHRQGMSSAIDSGVCPDAAAATAWTRPSCACGPFRGPGSGRDPQRSRRRLAQNRLSSRSIARCMPLCPHPRSGWPAPVTGPDPASASMPVPAPIAGHPAPGNVNRLAASRPSGLSATPSAHLAILPAPVTAAGSVYAPTAGTTLRFIRVGALHRHAVGRIVRSAMTGPPTTRGPLEGLSHERRSSLAPTP